MANMMKLMKQAAAMQQEMARVQEEVAAKTVEFSSGGGMVTATATGDGRVTKLHIDPKCVDAQDVAMLEDLVLAAVDGALAKGRELASAEMAKVTAGLGLPGMGLPGFG